MDSRAKRTVGVIVLLAGAGCTGVLDTPRGGPGDGSAPDKKSDPNSLDPTVCIPGIPGTSQLPRLTRAQYDQTVRDLLGVGGEPSTMLAPDTPGSVDRRAWDGYQLAAASLAAEVMADPALRSRIIPCDPAEAGEVCAAQFIEEFGLRAFRRPLRDEESTRFLQLFQERAEVTPNGTFEETVQLLLEAFLLSPSFLMRAEIAEEVEGEHYVLSGYEVASRLSYMLWGSMPDAGLFSAAAEGKLSEREGILAQAERMLLDPKGHAMVQKFHEHYLHMGPGTRWANIVRDPELYPEFEEGLAPLLTAETERFVEHVVFDVRGSFGDLLTLPVGFVNAQLAPLYDLDPAQYGSELEPVDLDGTRRAGLFTRLGFLASHSLYDRSSPILRGAFLQKDVLCAPIGAPPPDAEGTPLPTEGLLTNRDRVDAQTAAPACKGCHHAFINPTGFALESFDAVGSYQETESFSGAPIDTSADVQIGETRVPVNGPVELSRALADSSEAQTCYARRWVQFAYGRTLTNQDSCTVDDMTARLTAGGYTILDLVADLTQSDSFRFRALQVEAP